MKFEAAIGIIDSELKKFVKSGDGRKAVKKESMSTCSVYYVISNGKACLAFRVSDHPTNKNSIDTLDLSYKGNNQETICRFVKNRIDGLSRRSLNYFLGISEKKEWENHAQLTEIMTNAISL
jgi:hypothetical protein